MLPDSSPHYPVMLNDVIHQISSNPKNIILDATFGCGGYSKKILELFPHTKIVAFDRDDQVCKYADLIKKKFNDRFDFYNEKFSEIEKIIINKSYKVDHFIFDFGISSFQLDNYERGFSFNSDARLDMRMGKNKISAYELINEASFEDLSNIIKFFGEDKDSKKIAREVEKSRKIKSIETTNELRSIILKAKGNRYFKKDPCTKTFQSIRMVVNQELSEIFNTLSRLVSIAKNETCFTAVTFHSLEDKIVKKIFNYSKEINQNPSRYHPQLNNKKNLTFIKTTGKSIKPSESEINENPRSRSAKLRFSIKYGNEQLEINRKSLKMEKLFNLEKKYNV
jgi:16S rRNA (cytosine1402-N4)-methyltransferase